MEEEIYIEESNPFKVKITIIIILVLNRRVNSDEIY